MSGEAMSEKQVVKDYVNDTMLENGVWENGKRKKRNGKRSID